MNEINWNISEKTNEHFLPLYENRSRYLVLYGGAGSGKSHFVAQKHLLRIILSIKRNYQERFLFIRHVKKTCRQSVFALFKLYVNDAGLSKVTNINKTDMSFHFPNGSEVFCEGLDDPEKIKSYEGITSIWIEEAPELNREGFIQLDLRPRGKNIPSYVQICLSLNPVSKLNWVYKEFFQKENPDITLHHSTYKNNRFIDDKYVQVLEDLKKKDKVFYDIYALGKWGVLGNLVFTNWIVKEISTNPLDYEIIRCGLDFGYNNPSAFIRIGIKDDDIYVLDEFYQSGLTNPELIRALKPQVTEEDDIIGDSAEPDRIKEFVDAGYNVKASKKGKDSVKRGIEWTRRRKIYIHPSCVNTQNEISIYKYKEGNKMKESDEQEEPVSFKDHLMSALRYAVEDYVLYDNYDAESLGVAFA